MEFIYDAPTGTLTVKDESKKICRRVHHVKLVRVNKRPCARFVMLNMETIDVPIREGTQRSWKRAIRNHKRFEGTLPAPVKNKTGLFMRIVYWVVSLAKPKQRAI